MTDGDRIEACLAYVKTAEELLTIANPEAMRQVSLGYHNIVGDTDMRRLSNLECLTIKVNLLRVAFGALR